MTDFPVRVRDPSNITFCKSSLSKKKYPITIQTYPTQIVKVYFLLIQIFKDYWCTNKFAIRHKGLKVDPHTHKFITFNINIAH